MIHIIVRIWVKCSWELVEKVVFHSMKHERLAYHLVDGDNSFIRVLKLSNIRPLVRYMPEMGSQVLKSKATT